MKMLLSIFVLSLCVSVSALCLAAPGQPTVSGTMSTGETLTISVSSPGTKSTAAQRVSGGYSVWINPSGSCPDNWGAATYSLTGTPTNTASGTYTGLFEAHGAFATYFDTFYAGD